MIRAEAIVRPLGIRETLENVIPSPVGCGMKDISTITRTVIPQLFHFSQRHGDQPPSPRVSEVLSESPKDRLTGKLPPEYVARRD